MSDTVRFGVSIDQELLVRFDDLIDRGHYDNRSEAVRDMIQERLVNRQWEEGEEGVRELQGNLATLRITR